MRTEEELLRQAKEPQNNVLARLFLIALYYWHNVTIDDAGLYARVNARAVSSLLKNRFDYVFDRYSEEHLSLPEKNQSFIGRGEHIAKKAREFQEVFSEGEHGFYNLLSDDVFLLSIFMGALGTMVREDKDCGLPADKHSIKTYGEFEYNVPETLDKLEAQYNGYAQQEIDNARSRGERPNEASIRAHYREKHRQELRAYERLGYPYKATYDEYKRFLTNNFEGSVRILGERIRLQDILDIFIRSPIEARDFQTAHTYIVGRSGSGKSELLKQICRQARTSFVLLDPHGDLADEVSNNSFVSRVHRIAPHEQRFVINPFDIADKGDANRELVAQEITDLIAELVEDSGLSRLMTTIIFPIVSTLLKLEYADFRMLSDCLNPNTGKTHLQSLRGFVDPHLRGIWAELEGDTYDTSKQSVYNRLQSLLNYRLVTETLCGRDDFARAIEPALERNENIAISLPIPRIGEAVGVTIGRFLATRMQIWAKHRQHLDKSARRPVILIMDEFHNFMSQATAKTLDQYGRKFGLYMVLAHQHTAQITDREIRGSLLANTGNKVVGVCNHDTRQTVAREMNIDPEMLENLKTGHFVGKFGGDEAKTFYSRMVSGGRKAPYKYLESVNQDGDKWINGWEFSKPENKAKNTGEGFKPKFDI